jgi:nucleotide-binding universal stress UspA family protein
MVRYEATDTAGEIINTAREEQADLLVLSTRGSRGAEKKYIGSVTEYVLGTSSIDVLAIPPLHSEQND